MAHIYKNTDGQRVPSVTTISKLYGENDGLIIWANQQGLEGKTLADAREKTATPGTMTHERVDYFIQGKDWHPGPWMDRFSSDEAANDALAKSARAFGNFQRWYSQNRMELIAGEVALVSEKHQFGGRMDAIASTGGLCIADWKTGGGGKIYANFLYQVAGYSILWDENFPDQPLTGGFHIIRFNRDEADFAHWHFAELDKAREGFLLLRKLYDIHKQLKKRI